MEVDPAAIFLYLKLTRMNIEQKRTIPLTMAIATVKLGIQRCSESLWKVPSGVIDKVS